MHKNNTKAIANAIYWDLVKQVLNNNPGIMDNIKVGYYVDEILAEDKAVYYIADQIQKKWIGCSCSEGSKCENVRAQACAVRVEIKALTSALRKGNK